MFAVRASIFIALVSASAGASTDVPASQMGTRSDVQTLDSSTAVQAQAKRSAWEGAERACGFAARAQSQGLSDNDARVLGSRCFEAFSALAGGGADRQALAAFASGYGSELVTRVFRLAPEAIGGASAAAVSDAAQALVAAAGQKGRELGASLAEMQAAMEKNRAETLALAGSISAPSSVGAASAREGGAEAEAQTPAGAAQAPADAVAQAPLQTLRSLSRLQPSEGLDLRSEGEKRAYADAMKAAEQAWLRRGLKPDLPSVVMAAHEALDRYRKNNVGF